MPEAKTPLMVEKTIIALRLSKTTSFLRLRLAVHLCLRNCSPVFLLNRYSCLCMLLFSVLLGCSSCCYTCVVCVVWNLYCSLCVFCAASLLRVPSSVTRAACASISLTALAPPELRPRPPVCPAARRLGGDALLCGCDCCGGRGPGCTCDVLPQRWPAPSGRSALTRCRTARTARPGVHTLATPVWQRVPLADVRTTDAMSASVSALQKVELGSLPPCPLLRLAARPSCTTTLVLRLCQQRWLPP